MDDVRVADPAYRHGLTEDQILHAFRQAMYSFDVDDDMVMFIGGDPSGQLLEIGVVASDEGSVILHAMHARARFLR